MKSFLFNSLPIFFGLVLSHFSSAYAWNIPEVSNRAASGVTQEEIRTQFNEYYSPKVPAVLSVAEFEAMARASMGKGLENFLENLSKNKSIFMHGNVLVYASKSPVQATPEFPRVILFTNNSPVVITYGGNPSQKEESNKIEVMMHTSLKQGEPAKPVLYKYDFSPGARMFKSGPNPRECIACHGERAKPIIDPYQFWAGWYGTHHGLLFPAEEAVKEFKAPMQIEALAKEYEFAQRYGRTFQKQKASGQGVYRFLPDPNAGETGILVPTPPGKYFPIHVRTLQSLLGHFNTSRIIDVLNDPRIFDLRYAILSVYLSCQTVWNSTYSPRYEPSIKGIPLDEYIPEAIRKTFSRSIQQLEVEQKMLIEKSLLHRSEFFRRVTGSSSTPDPRDIFSEKFVKDGTFFLDREGPRIAALRYLIEGRGVSMADLFLQGTVMEESYYQASVFETHLEEEVWREYFSEMKKRDPKLIQFEESLRRWDSSSPADIENEAKTCVALKELSLAELSKQQGVIVEPSPIKTGSKQSASLQSCVSCHTARDSGGATRASYLPFDRPESLDADQLAKIRFVISPEGHAQKKGMPPGGNPMSSGEQELFMKNLGRPMK